MLTREQVLKLEGESFNRAVAEHVMGWKPPGHPSTSAARKRLRLEHSTYDRDMLSPEGRLAVPPDFHADAAADYTVLVHVREHWGERAKRQFAMELYEFQRSDLQRWPNPDVSLVYRPGDYSLAALLALSKKE